MAKVKTEAQAEPWADNLDRMPLYKRRRKLLSDKPSSSSSLPCAPPLSSVDMAVKRVSPGAFWEWPGLPRGVKFDPSDEELLWHLLAKVGIGEAEPHPLISEFIISLDEDDGFGYTHPQKLAGVKQDGSMSYFFHRRFKAFNSGNRKCRKMQNGDFGDVHWHKIGKTKPVIINGIHQGCKKIMVLYVVMKKGEKPEKTNWVMHQYHIGRGEDGEGEFFASKVFYQQKSRQSDKTAQDLNLDTVEAAVTEAEAAVDPISVVLETHAENQHMDLISMDASAQAESNHENRGEETCTDAECGKLDKCDSLSKEDPERGEFEPRDLLDSQHRTEGIIACGDLCQTQSSCVSEAERRKSCISDNDLIGVKALEKGSKECQNDGSSGLSANLMDNINEHVTWCVQSEPHPADAQLPLDVCYVDRAPEIATAKLMSISPIDSADSMIAASPFAVDKSLPSTLNCQTTVLLEPRYSLENKSSDTIFSCQASVPEVKSSVAEEEHGYMIANSGPDSSAFSTFLVHLKAEPLEEGNVNGLSETDAAMEYSAGVLGSSDKGFEEDATTRSLSEARSCMDNLLFEVSKTQESNEKCLNEAHISESKLSNLGQRLVHQNDNSQLFDSVQSTLPMEIKAEPWEESYTSGLLETTAEKLQCDNNQLFDSVPSTFPVEIKAETLGESYTNSVPDTFTGELRNTSLSGYPTENISAVTQCSLKNNLLSGGRNVQENILSNCTFSHQTSIPKDIHRNSNAAELLSTTVLGSGSSHSSENSYMISQYSEKAGSCQDNISSIGSKSQEETENICFDQASFPEGVHYDATNKLQNSNCPVKVKFEPLESEQLMCKNFPSSFPDFNTLRAEVKGEFLDELSTDVIDHIPLKYRIEMPLSGTTSNLGCSNSLKCSQKTAGRTSKCGSVKSLNAKASRFCLQRKRKKTATDSLETALEEDAPGLLKVLLDRGITIEEIKLYGDMEDDEPLEISSSDDSFEELETVITKLFSERSSLFKFSTERHINGSKSVYCLACLISLIEQTRYLRFRNSPVEWGWCRDLQSFIFVFERHNRIVLERPEYGYATYFFEIVDSLPVEWQIRRLVTAMKLSSCSRTTLIENRSLVVGEDLTEGEARVLEEYGWTPNTGLGSMLNYCNRVVHDKRNEMYSSDWRAKIGKMLMNGHDGGRTVVADLPKKVVEYMGNQSPAIKLEL